MPLYGLIGRNLSHSFSADYFNKKFKTEGLNKHEYRLYELENIDMLPDLIRSAPDMIGLNVTIPYKTAVLRLADTADAATGAIGAANTLKIVRRGGVIVIKAFNTDHMAFGGTLKQVPYKAHKNALILGTGGAARAVAHALGSLHIGYKFVTRLKNETGVLTYKDLDRDIINRHTLIVNATPVGMHPQTIDCPDIPYKFLSHRHFLYDLIYNPSLTEFLKKGQQQNAYICNGLNMLYAQAEYSWNIWQDDNL